MTNSTPNYKFVQTAKLCAVDAIDRELRRVEDKVDAIDRRVDCKSIPCAPNKPAKPCKCGCEALQAQIDELREELANKANKEEEREWFDLSLIEGYMGIGNSTAQYCKDQFGFVHLKGHISFENGSGVPFETDFAVLPEGFYPKDGLDLPIASRVYSANNGAFGEPIVLQITNEGVLTIRKQRVDLNYSLCGPVLDNVTFYVG